ncbi:hypothetical protein [Intrasporangium flavum]|uniref:hypothetical protein n=1 Tax=Intrasporangium flavum TaxID=1428657 RepID=UPI00096CB124|nr:hypothetical protein [Intrasporangium flavum]
MDLASLARDDVVSAAHARTLGVTSAELRRRVRAGQAYPLHRGWYATRRPRDARDRHLLRTTALLQEYGGQAVASHGSALVLLGLPLEAVDLGTVHLMWIGSDTTYRSYSRVHVHEGVDASALPHRGLTVHPALAVVQSGLRDVASLVVAGDAALRRGDATRREVEAAIAALRGQRGLVRARSAVPWLDPRHESPGESMTALVLRGLGYDLEPQFEPGTLGPNGFPERADFVIRGSRVLVEFDGRSKYAAGSPDEAQALLFAEKRREDAFRRVGYEVVRLTWGDLHRPAEVRSRIEAALARDRSRRRAV